MDLPLSQKNFGEDRVQLSVQAQKKWKNPTENIFLENLKKPYYSYYAEHSYPPIMLNYYAGIIGGTLPTGGYWY